MREVTVDSPILDKPFTEIFKSNKQFISPACKEHIIKAAGIKEERFNNYSIGRTTAPRSFKFLFLQVLALYYPVHLYQEFEEVF